MTFLLRCLVADVLAPTSWRRNVFAPFFDNEKLIFFTFVLGRLICFLIDKYHFITDPEGTFKLTSLVSR